VLRLFGFVIGFGFRFRYGFQFGFGLGLTDFGLCWFVFACFWASYFYRLLISSWCMTVLPLRLGLSIPLLTH
jgi:hypothetical protein